MLAVVVDSDAVGRRRTGWNLLPQAAPDRLSRRVRVCFCVSMPAGGWGARAAAWGARGGQELHLLLRLFLSLGPPWHSRHGLSQGFPLHISLVWFPNTSSVCFPDWFVDLNEEKPSWRKYQCPNTKQHVILCKSVAFAWFDRHDDKARWMHV